MITGSLVAIITPMHEDGRLDLARFKQLIDWHAAEGTDGVVVVGTTGESPTVNVEVIQMCRRYSKLCMPGAFTPTEVVTAWQAGADIVKVFPSDLVGPKYLKLLHGPLPHIRLMPTGGVNLDTAAEFLAAGACALGVGSSLVDQKALAAGDLKKIESLAKQFVAKVAEYRAGKRA